MKYIVYLTINTKSKINNLNRIYVGVHQTKDPEIFDGYIGCGVYVHRPGTYINPKHPFQYAVRKYGCSAFIRYILYIFDTIEEAYAKEAEIVDINFVKQKHTYNASIGGLGGMLGKPLYQFDLKGNLIKKWEYSKECYDYYGLDSDKFDSPKRNKCVFLNSLWSTSDTININEYSVTQKSHLVYLYSKEGKLLKMFNSLTECSQYLNYNVGELSRSIRNQVLIQNQYYASNKLVDIFIPKAKRQYINYIYYVYKNGELLGTPKGKELMNYIDLHSWDSIRNIFTRNNNWYKDYYISLEPIDNIPTKRIHGGFNIDILDLEGNYIETLDSIKKVRDKYNVSYYLLKGIQNEPKYIGNYIFKYKQ